MSECKTCSKCLIEKPITNFALYSRRGFGRESRCRICKNEQNRLYKIRKRELLTESRKAYRDKNPLKIKAHLLLNRAISKGEVIKKPCCVCGNSKAYGHHTDYHKPLDVMWLCGEHHRAWHRIFLAENLEHFVPFKKYGLGRKRHNPLRAKHVFKNLISSTCGRGHPITPQNTYSNPNGRSYCRLCNNEYYKKYKAKKKAAQAHKLMTAEVGSPPINKD